jgi:uncharacterized repeat protein (TIGR01451 family)
MRRPGWGLLAALALAVQPAAAQVLSITKVAQDPQISAGDTATFVIVVQNASFANALNVTLSDPLPVGLAWTDNSSQCAIASGTLSCSFGTLLTSEVVTVSVSATTTAASCGTLINTATVSSSNASSKEDSAAIVVSCPSLLTSVASAQAQVTPGERFGFTTCVANLGIGIARNVRVQIDLPSLGWKIEPLLLDCEFKDDSVLCGFGDMALGDGRCLHLVATTQTCETLSLTPAITADNATVGSGILILTPRVAGDQDANCGVAVTDVFRLINFLFAGGPGPSS